MIRHFSNQGYSSTLSITHVTPYISLMVSFSHYLSLAYISRLYLWSCSYCSIPGAKTKHDITKLKRNNNKKHWLFSQKMWMSFPLGVPTIHISITSHSDPRPAIHGAWRSTPLLLQPSSQSLPYTKASNAQKHRMNFRGYSTSWNIQTL